jgi:hypothetical protein
MHIGMRPVRTLKLASTGTSSQTAAFGANIEYVRIITDADVHVEIGVNPTATTSNIYIPADDVEYFKVSEGEKLAAIGTANVYITELSE